MILEPPHRPVALSACLLALWLGWQAQGAIASAHPTDGWVLLAAAAVLFASACRTRETAEGADQPLWHDAPPASQPSSRRLLLLCVIMFVAAVGLFAADRWLGAAWFLHAISIVLGVVAFWARQSPPLSSGAPSSGGWARWLLLGIVLIAFGVRVWELDSLPEGVMSDEALYGLEARRILHQPGYAPLPYVESTQRPPHYSALVAVSFALFGDSPASIRLVTLLFSLLGIIAAYGFFNHWFGADTHAGLIGAACLTALRYDLTFSRIAIDGISTPLFILLALWLLVRGFARGRLLEFVLAGVTLGLSMAFYLPMRLFVVWLLAVGAGAAGLDAWRFRNDLSRRARWRAWMPHVGATVLGFALASAPIAVYAVRAPAIFFERQSSASIFFEPEEPDLVRRLFNNTWKHLAMYNGQGSSFGRDNLPGAPLLDPLSGTLVALGFALTVSCWRERRAALMLLLFAAMLQAGILSWDREAPNALRTLGALPALVYFNIAALLAVRATVARAVRVRGPLWDGERLKIVWGAALIVLFSVIGVRAADLYFNHQMRNTDVWATHDIGASWIGRRMQSHGDEPLYYVAPVYWQRPAIAYFAPTAQTRPWTNDLTMPLASTDGRPVILFLDYWHAATLEAARRTYAGVSVVELRPPWGGLVYVYEVAISADEIRRVAGW